MILPRRRCPKWAGPVARVSDNRTPVAIVAGDSLRNAGENVEGILTWLDNLSHPFALFWTP